MRGGQKESLQKDQAEVKPELFWSSRQPVKEPEVWAEITFRKRPRGGGGGAATGLPGLGAKTTHGNKDIKPSTLAYWHTEQRQDMELLSYKLEKSCCDE